MKITILLMLLATTSVFGQSAASKRAAQIAGKPAPLPNQAAIMAAASTNFEARCAADFRWRDATNKLAKAVQAEAVAEQTQKAAQRKLYLAEVAGQKTPAMIADLKAATASAATARKSVAACELQKIQAEEAVRSLMIHR
jgi:hypothetical protein